MSNDIQSAVERARMVAAKITGQIADVGSAKRPADSSSNSIFKFFNYKHYLELIAIS